MFFIASKSIYCIQSMTFNCGICPIIYREHTKEILRSKCHFLTNHLIETSIESKSVHHSLTQPSHLYVYDSVALPSSKQRVVLFHPTSEQWTRNIPNNFRHLVGSHFWFVEIIEKGKQLLWKKTCCTELKK